MSIHRKGSKWVVRYREGERNRSRSFDRKADADRYDVEVTRRRQLGTLAPLTTGSETLDAFVTETWAPTHGVTLAPKTRRNYASLYDHHIAPALGALRLRDLRVETIARWQADRLAAGAGPVAVRQALDLLGSLLQVAFELERIPSNPSRRVRKALRHSFASLLLHEGRSVIYVARQLGHDARLTLTRYGHVIDELEDQPRASAEDVIRDARRSLSVPRPVAGTADVPMELAGLEPATSWVRSRHSPN